MWPALKTIAPNCGARQTAESTAKLNSAFCKQMVAVTLAANVIGSDVAADGDGTLGRIRDVAATLFSLPQCEAGS